MGLTSLLANIRKGAKHEIRRPRFEGPIVQTVFEEVWFDFRPGVGIGLAVIPNALDWRKLP